MSANPSSTFFTGQGFNAPQAYEQQWSFVPEQESFQGSSGVKTSGPKLSIDLEYQGYILSDLQKQDLLNIKNTDGSPWLTSENYAANIELANLFRNTPPEDWTDMIQYLVENATQVGMFPWNLPANDKYIHTYELRLAARGTKVVGTPWDQPCRICKKKEVYYVRFQIRSPDEPETTFFRCHACGANWKDSC